MNNSRFIKTLRHTWVMTLQAESIAPGSSTEVASVDFSYVCSRCGAKASYNYHVDKDGNPYDETLTPDDPVGEDYRAAPAKEPNEDMEVIVGH